MKKVRKIGICVFAMLIMRERFERWISMTVGQ